MCDTLLAGPSDKVNYGSSNAQILMGCWGQGGTPLIRELEHTVTVAERKCGDLMQQLTFYKTFCKQLWTPYEVLKHAAPRVNENKKKARRKAKRSYKLMQSNSSSDNDCRKASLPRKASEINEELYEMLKSKISDVNSEITEANRKINETAILLPTKKSKEKMNMELCDNKLACDKRGLSRHTGGLTTQSETAVSGQNFDNEESALITAEDFRLYKKLSNKSLPAKKKTPPTAHKHRIQDEQRVQRYKLRKRQLPSGMTRKLAFGSYIDVLSDSAEFDDNAKLGKAGKVKVKPAAFKTKKPVVLKSARKKVSNTKLRDSTKANKSEVNIRQKEHPPKKATSQGSFDELKKSMNTNCIREAINDVKKDIAELEKKTSEVPAPSMKSNAMTAVVPYQRKNIPFIAATSTSRSYNFGLNVQQVLYLMKHKRHTDRLQNIVQENIQNTRSVVNPLETVVPIVKTLLPHSLKGPRLVPTCPAKSDDGLSISTEHSDRTFLHCKDEGPEEFVTGEVAKSTGKPERPEDVWVVDQPGSKEECHRVRSQCICFPSKQCVDYRRLLKQYTGLAVTKSETFSVPVNLYQPQRKSSTCFTSQLHPIASEEALNCGQHNVSSEVTKIQNDLVNLHSKYVALHEQISKNDLDDYEANAELDAMESELATRELEYKDIMVFYHQLMILRDKLSDLRHREDPKFLLEQSSRQDRQERPDRLRPTSSMTLTRVLRHVQCLQDKIRLVDVP